MTPRYRSVNLTRGDYSVRGVVLADGMIRAGALSGLVSAWERRGWAISYFAEENG